MTDPTPSPLDDLIAAYLQALERGESPNRAALLTANPQHAKDLAAFFADFDRVQAAAPGNHYDNHANLDATKPPRGESHAGEIIAGRYKLLENIGEGGMGSVWVAEQTQPVKRRVAIKLIKAGMDSKQVLARFEAERQALAMMDHPNIARVFDGGMTELGRPYFVMEYVKGTPFTEYCDQARLSLKERLQLFIPVCGAVQHAHQKGIIHRDLKPSNILICLYDGKPVPKVIDFGLAKAMHQPLTENSIYTGHGVMVGTPLYMSPEQAEQNNLDVDTRTDIYSLGVVLYELLTGATPLERDQLRKAAADEVLRLIREVEAIRPSIRMSASASLPSIAAQRNINPRELRKSLAGDLDWIVMKSLEKERSRRYETANGLARDIERYLGDEAVEACPPSTSYRLKKYFRKHKLQVITAGVVLATLLVGLAGTTFGILRARRAEAETKATNVDLREFSEGMLKVLEHGYAEMQDMKDGTSTYASKDAAYRLNAEFKDGAIISTSSSFSASEDSPSARKAIVKELDEWLTTAIRNNRLAKELAERQVEIAERQMIEGLLRPIGHGYEPNTSELRCYIDWSALPNDRLKIRVLEIAFENPEIAMRLAQRADRVSQASVALSPKRRALAMELLSAKQRDMKADPRVRIAAAWLALELEATDLPALPEVLTWLRTIKGSGTNASPNPECAEFVDYIVFRAGHFDLSQQSQVVNTLIEIVEQSHDDDLLKSSQKALATFASTSTPEQIMRGTGAILDKLKKTDNTLYTEGDALVALATRLDSDQAAQCWWSLSELLKGNPSYSKVTIAREAMEAIALRLSQEEAVRGWNSLLSVLESTSSRNVSEVVGSILEALAPKLGSEQVTSASDFLLRATENDLPYLAERILPAIAPKLSPAKAVLIGDMLLVVLEKDSGGDWSAKIGATTALKALTAKLSPEQVTRSLKAFLVILEAQQSDLAMRAAAKGLVGLSQNMSPDQVTQVGNALLNILEQSQDSDTLRASAVALVGISPRLKPEEASRGWMALIGLTQRRGEIPRSTLNGASLAALALNLSPDRVTQSWESLLAVLEKESNYGAAYGARFALEALVPKLNSEQVMRSHEVLIGVLKKSKDWDLLRPIGEALVALSAKMSPEQRDRTAKAMVKVLQSQRDWDITTPLFDMLLHLDPSQREQIGMQAMTFLMLQMATSDTYFSSELEEDYQVTTYKAFRPAAMSLTNQRVLAAMLMHPACVGEAREWMLQRFEELTFHDGNRVFLTISQLQGEDEPKSDVAPALKTTSPQRRFKTLHAAADWIQKNWPDFDLEATPEVKPWRGEE